jgi:predicted  nucleic acid-binding Zn-ribbon protein
MNIDKDESQLDVLTDIRDEMRNLNAELARIDERSRATSKEVARLREERVIPVEKQADANTGRSRRNAVILSGGIAAASILITFALGLIPL